MTTIEDKIKQIIKFVEVLYKPYKSKVVHVVIRNRKVYTIGFYFEEIPNNYISVDHPKNPKKNKEYNFNNEIRTYIENYLGIKTTGYQPKNNFNPPPEDHGITIVTHSDK